jgi:hypothetical protein
MNSNEANKTSANNTGTNSGSATPNESINIETIFTLDQQKAKIEAILAHPDCPAGRRKLLLYNIP